MADGTNIRFELLSERHEYGRFTSGHPELDLWMRKHAKRGNEAGLARTLVWVKPQTPCIILAFGSLSAMSLERDEELTRANRRQLPSQLPRQIPAVLLGRMAVLKNLQGQGLGRIVYEQMEAEARAAAEHVGAAFLVVDAKDEGLKDMYTRFGFTRGRKAKATPSAYPTRLLLPLKSLQ